MYDQEETGPPSAAFDGDWKTASGRGLADFAGGDGGAGAANRASTQQWLRHRRWMHLAYPRLTMRWGRREDRRARPRVSTLRKRHRVGSRVGTIPAGASEADGPGGFAHGYSSGEPAYHAPGGWWYPGLVRLAPNAAMAVAVVFLEKGIDQVAAIMCVYGCMLVCGIVVAVALVGARDPSKTARVAPPGTALVASSAGLVLHSGLHMLFTETVDAGPTVRLVRHRWVVRARG